MKENKSKQPQIPQEIEDVEAQNSKVEEAIGECYNNVANEMILKINHFLLSGI